MAKGKASKWNKLAGLVGNHPDFLSCTSARARKRLLKRVAKQNKIKIPAR